MTISCYTALCSKLLPAIYSLFHLIFSFNSFKFQKNPAREAIIFIFMNEKHRGSEMLSMLPMITQLVSGKIRIWIQNLDPLIQVSLVPKPMFITINLENGTSLILDSKQLRKMIFQNVSCPSNRTAFSL